MPNEDRFVIAENRIKIFGWLCHKFKCKKFGIGAQ